MTVQDRQKDGDIQLLLPVPPSLLQMRGSSGPPTALGKLQTDMLEGTGNDYFLQLPPAVHMFPHIPFQPARVSPQFIGGPGGPESPGSQVHPHFRDQNHLQKDAKPPGGDHPEPPPPPHQDVTLGPLPLASPQTQTSSQGCTHLPGESEG